MQNEFTRIIPDMKNILKKQVCIKNSEENEMMSHDLAFDIF